MELLLSLYTLVALAGFLKICAMVFDPKREQAFRAAAEIPFNDPESLAENRKRLILSAF